MSFITIKKFFWGLVFFLIIYKIINCFYVNEKVNKQVLVQKLIKKYYEYNKFLENELKKSLMDQEKSIIMNEKINEEILEIKKELEQAQIERIKTSEKLIEVKEDIKSMMSLMQKGLN